MATPMRAIPRPVEAVLARRPELRDVRFAAIVLFAALTLSMLVGQERWQAAGCLATVAATVTLYVRWPPAGLVLLLALWIVAPFVRRVLDLVTYTSGSDLLSVAPFIATGMVGLAAWQRLRPIRTPALVAALALAGLALGVPTGLGETLPLLYATLAYSAGVMALFIGYSDWRDGRPVVERILLVLVPLAALYAIWQYFLPVLPAWDELWLRTVQLASVGTKENGDFRAFGPLNSPATLAAVSAVLVAMVVMRDRIDPWRIAAGGLAGVALALTFVRSAWIGLVLGLLLAVLVARGIGGLRLAALAAVVGLLFATVGSETGATGAVVDRASTLTDVESDVSFQERFETLVETVPEAVTAPLGHGLGSAGQASQLAGQQNFDVIDNGYVMILYQTGLVGFLLTLGPVGYVVWMAMTRFTPDQRRRALPLLAGLLTLAVMLASGDVLYGITGVLVWYCVGGLLAIDREQRVETRPRWSRASAARG